MLSERGKHPLSLIHGPAGTGKTSTIVAYTLARLTRSVDERIVVCSPRNVAVQVLVQSAAAAMEEDDIKYPRCYIGPFPIIHVESEGVIDKRYLCFSKWWISHPEYQYSHCETLS